MFRAALVCRGVEDVNYANDEANAPSSSMLVLDSQSGETVRANVSYFKAEFDDAL